MADVWAQYATLAVSLATLGLVFKLPSDMAGLRERMARIEGLFEGYATRRPQQQNDAAPWRA